MEFIDYNYIVNMKKPTLQTVNTSNKVLDLQALRIKLAHTEKVLCKSHRDHGDIDNNMTLAKEMILFQRLMYLLKLKYRKDKSYKLMQMLHKMLIKWRNFNYKDDIKDFKDLVPQNYNNMGLTKVPSKDMLYYFFHKTLVETKLVYSVICYARESAHYIETHFYEEKNLIVSYLFFSVLSNICSLSIKLLFSCNHLYNDLYLLRNHFTCSNNGSISNENDIPPDLISWLNADWLRESTSKKQTVMNVGTKKLKKKMKCETVDLTQNIDILSQIIDITDDDSKPFDITKDSRSEPSVTSILDDQMVNSEVPGRERRKKDKAGKKRRIKEQLHSSEKRIKLNLDAVQEDDNAIKPDGNEIVNSLRSFDDIKEFIERQEKMKINGSTGCLYKSLDSFVFNMMLASVKSVLDNCKTQDGNYVSVVKRILKLNLEN